MARYQRKSVLEESLSFRGVFILSLSNKEVLHDVLYVSVNRPFHGFFNFWHGKVKEIRRHH